MESNDVLLARIASNTLESLTLIAPLQCFQKSLEYFVLVGMSLKLSEMNFAMSSFLYAAFKASR
ncbi:MAG: hypothetical protein E7110_04950 [Bacteroidales bacterium]|nr:hypothetical protein [Bacteroidales bacterium]